MKKIIAVVFTMLFFCLSAQAGDQKFHTKIPPKSSGSTESGALLFAASDSLDACFLKVLSASKPDFKLCESSASAILPVGVELQVYWRTTSRCLPGCRDRRYKELNGFCNREWPVRRIEYAYKLVKNGTDGTLEQNPAIYNEKSPEFPTAKKLADGRRREFRWFLDEN